MKRLIAEFESQKFTQIIFPHEETDWIEYIDEAKENFIEIINAIRYYQKCRIICSDIEKTKNYFTNYKNLEFVKYKSDDTWARDCSALSIEEDGVLKLLDFTFNGWGGKFNASKDNTLTQHIDKDAIKCDFILEGGGVESNGDGLILTTSECMLNKNRNNGLSKEQITQKLKNYFGAKEILYLNHGYLAGDDTDSHIDTLVRFIDKDRVMFVECQDKEDEHYKELNAMKSELKELAKKYNFELIALPMSDAIYYDSERLPATYANFLFVNGAVLVPTYDVQSDIKALEIFQSTFQNREIIPIKCSTLIRQHGSLHCVTMNYATLS
jgi:agmatine/peptidylarginine deiminase